MSADEGKDTMAELGRKEQKAQKKLLKKKAKEKAKHRKKIQNGLDLCLIILCFFSFLTAAGVQMIQEWNRSRRAKRKSN